MKKTTLLLGLLSTLLNANEGKALLERKCASCHLLTLPSADIIPTLKAPAMEAVGFHIKLAMNEKKDLKNFITDYVINPDISKSVCESNKVAKFGVMPSQKGKVSKEELDKIANYIIDNYPTKEFTALITEIQTNDKISTLVNSPFLLNSSGLPHLTKMLLENWDKEKLSLSNEQKTKLLTVRKETLTTVKSIKKQIKAIEEEIVETMVSREDYKKLDVKVQKVGELKIEATKAHLKCINDTLDILNDEQISYLLPFGDY